MTKAAEITPEREVEIRAAVAQWRHPLPVGTLGRMLADAVAIIDAERAKVAELEKQLQPAPRIGTPLPTRVSGEIVPDPGFNWEISQEALDKIAEIERHIYRGPPR